MSILAEAPTYPLARMRRLRRSEGLRAMVRETVLRPADLVLPLFVRDGLSADLPVASMPGVSQISVDSALRHVGLAMHLGIRGFLLFGIPEAKDDAGTGAYSEDGVVQRAVSSVKARFPEAVLIADTCLCEYTSHGHCGIVRGDEVDNDETLPMLARTAVSQAAAGADIVAPSNMMDGTVAVIREALDANGYGHIPILAYSAKYASSFYGPFRDAAESAPAFGDRRSYQMDPANAREALREVAIDLSEGADAIIVKPALAYLDVLSAARREFAVPLAAYNVSGEYAMVKAAAQNGWLEERRTVMEILTGMKRAGADFIITYHALDAARWLDEDR